VANECLTLTVETYHIIEHYLTGEKGKWFDETKIAHDMVVKYNGL